MYSHLCATKISSKCIKYNPRNLRHVEKTLSKGALRVRSHVQVQQFPRAKKTRQISSSKRWNTRMYCPVCITRIYLWLIWKILQWKKRRGVYPAWSGVCPESHGFFWLGIFGGMDPVFCKPTWKKNIFWQIKIVFGFYFVNRGLCDSIRMQT